MIETNVITFFKFCDVQFGQLFDRYSKRAIFIFMLTIYSFHKTFYTNIGQ